MLILDELKSIFDELDKTLRAKNADYTGSKDEFANFMRSAEVAGVSVEQGIIVRIMDKMSRLGSLLGENRNPEVKDERIQDTIKDAIGYLVILSAYLNKLKSIENEDFKSYTISEVTLEGYQTENI